MATRSTTTMKCPKCKSKPDTIMEEWSGLGQHYDLDERGNVISSCVGDMSNDKIYHARCSNCKNQWKLNKGDIEEIEHWEDNKKAKDSWYYMDEKDMLHQPKK